MVLLSDLAQSCRFDLTIISDGQRSGVVREAARSEDRRNLLGCIEWSSPFARLDAASNALKQRLAVRILAEIKAPLFSRSVV